MSNRPTITVVVALHDADPAPDWFDIGQILIGHHVREYEPLPSLPVRRTVLPLRRGRDLLPRSDDQRTPLAAGGRIRRLDLHAHATTARIAAEQRWVAWHQLVARQTPVAKTWEQQIEKHLADPTGCTQAEAQRRFEAQPRVQAMLAHSTNPATIFDPLRLAEYQAGQAVYVALHWQHALTGDAFIAPDGQLLRPAGPAIADRLRCLADASHIVNNLSRWDWLAAVRTTAPST